jgi:hypothetical protein
MRGITYCIRMYGVHGAHMGGGNYISAHGSTGGNG